LEANTLGGRPRSLYLFGRPSIQIGRPPKNAFDPADVIVDALSAELAVIDHILSDRLQREWPEITGETFAVRLFQHINDFAHQSQLARMLLEKGFVDE
jgi:hypothetical protein